MSIIIEKDGRRVYKTIGHLAYEDKERADKLDRFLKKEIDQIEEGLLEKGLLDLKGRPGAIALWYNVGVELRKLWKRVREEFKLPDTFITIFMKAVYDNSNKIKLGSGRADRLRNAHFYYCYLMADLPWEIVARSGSWTEWVEFLDSKRIRDDQRIIEWFVNSRVMESEKGKGLTREQWFRTITRSIRNELREIDTTVLEKDELYQKLDRILVTINVAAGQKNKESEQK